MNHSIVALSSWEEPILPQVMKALATEHLTLKAVICAGRMTEQAKRIVASRVEEYFLKSDFFLFELPTTPFYFVKNHNSVGCLNVLQEIKPDLILNVGTPNIIKQPLLEVPRLGVLNSHPGLIPDYRGCTCVEWAIFNDDPVGATCHFMTQQIDRGPVLVKNEMKILTDWSYRKIRTEMNFHQINTLIQGVKEAFRLGVNYTYLPSCEEGTYYSPIDNDKMKDVLSKIEQGTYKHLIG